MPATLIQLPCDQAADTPDISAILGEVTIHISIQYHRNRSARRSAHDRHSIATTIKSTTAG